MSVSLQSVTYLKAANGPAATLGTQRHDRNRTAKPAICTSLEFGPVDVLQSLQQVKITKPEHAYRHLKTRISNEVEEFWAIALNSEKAVIASACLFRGTVDLCLFHPRDVFRFGYAHNASSLLVAHNHPSGNARPSPEDADITEQLLKAAEFLRLPVVDHLILSGNKYYSFLAAKVVKVGATGPSPNGQAPGLY